MDWANWDPHPDHPRGSLPDLGPRDYTPTPVHILNQLQAVRDGVNGHIDQLKNSPLYRIGVDHNINPEFTKLMGGLLGQHVRDQINKGLLDFSVEVPGFNSNRAFIGLNWRF